MTCNLSTARQRFGGVSRPLACDILAGVCSFEVGVDGLCERNGDGQCIVGRQRNGTGAAGRSWSEKNVKHVCYYSADVVRIRLWCRSYMSRRACSVSQGG